jgi:microcompartment protein CcmK/EutM
MRVCEIVGSVWPEAPIPALHGKALALVRDVHDHHVFAALDPNRTGAGARVLVVLGEPARVLAGGPPVDAVIVGVVDSSVVADIPAATPGVQGSSRKR